jgi:hypothetical protein
VPGGAQQRDLPPFSRRADAPKTESPNLTKHQTSQNQYQRGSRDPSYVRPYDGERNLSLHLSRPTIVYGAGSRRLRDADAKRKAGCDHTTQSQQPPTKNLRPRRRPHSALMPRRVKINLQPHETPNITGPVPERKSCPLTRTPPRWRTELVTPFVLPDNGLRIGHRR